MVRDWRIEAVEQHDGERPGRHIVLGPIGVDVFWKGWHPRRRNLVAARLKGKYGDLLRFSVFQDGEVVLRKPFDTLAGLVGHDRVDEYQPGGDAHRRDIHVFRRGLLR